MNKGDFAIKEKLFQSDSVMCTYCSIGICRTALFHICNFKFQRLLDFMFLNAFSEQSFPVLYVLVLYQFDAHFFLCIEEVVELPSFA